MADVKDWSTTAGNNDQAAPDGFPEGMMPGGVNDASREVMRAVRQMVNDLPWFEYGDSDEGYTAAYVAADKFTINGTDQTAKYYPGRRVRVVAPTPGTIYGGITAVTFSGGNTEVEVSWDGTGLTNESITSVALAMGEDDNVGISGWLVKPQTLSNETEFVISGDILALYDPICIHLSGLRPATNDDSLAVQVSQTTGSPWVSSGYKYSGPFTQADSATVGVINNNSASNVVFTTSVGSGVSDRVSGLIEVRQHWASARTMLTSNMVWRESNSDQRTGQVGGWTEAAVHQAIRIYFETGNISEGEISVTGTRRS